VREKREKRKTDAQPLVSETAGDLPQQELDAEAEIRTEQDESACKMHVESLLNYVAFSRREQQRVFLPDTTGVPPPPPPPPSAKKVDAEDEEAEKANAQVQLALRGAIDLKRSDVAISIYDQLQKDEVELTAVTFALLIQACVSALDLQGASDFLMKMETAGYMPDSELLDMVMDLYNRQKAQKSHSKDAKVEFTQEFKAANGFHSWAEELAARVDAEGPRTKLSATASAFVPTFVPPPFVPAQLTDEANEELLRTKLTAAAKPFEPKFNDNTDHGMYVWTGDASEDHYFEQGGDCYPEKSKGKGKGKGKGKSKEKGKGRGKSGDTWWKDQIKDSWWEYENEDPVWEATEWETYRNDEGRKNGAQKHTKTHVDVKKSGGLVWRPKATGKENDANVTS
jgi:hypothetical protein